MLSSFFEQYVNIEHPLAQVQLALFMLGMGATLSWRDFALIAKQPRDLLLGLICVLVAGPLIAWGLAEVADVSAGISMGLVLVGALPGGSLSNVFTWIARGNAALSIALSGCGAVISLITIPITLQLLAASYVPADFEMPTWEIIREIILFVLVPLGVGMVIGARISIERAASFSRWMIRLGFLLVIVMVVGSLGAGRVELDRYGWGVPLLIILFCLLMQQLCMLPFRLIRWPKRDFVAIGLEVTIRNVYLGILLYSILFPRSSDLEATVMGMDVLFVVLFYGAASMCCGLPLALRIRRALGREIRASQKD